MSTHFREECEHGWVGRRCRCPGPHAVRRVDCPKPGDPGFAYHAAYVEKQVEEARLTELASSAAENTLARLYELLRLALKEANADAEHKRKILENPYCNHERFQEYREAFGVSRGLARAMEIVEELSSAD